MTCDDCKGSGWYVGFLRKELCRTCDGTRVVGGSEVEIAARKAVNKFGLSQIQQKQEKQNSFHDLRNFVFLDAAEAMSDPMSDPYDLLRRARAILSEYDIPEGEVWLRDYNRLPGARLTKREVRALCASPCKMQKMDPVIMEKLHSAEYVCRVPAHWRPEGFEWQRNRKGQEARRLQRDEPVLFAPRFKRAGNHE